MQYERSLMRDVGNFFDKPLFIGVYSYVYVGTCLIISKAIVSVFYVRSYVMVFALNLNNLRYFAKNAFPILLWSVNYR